MIRKLRRRFIVVNMCILTSVLIGVLSGIYVFMYSSEVRISYELMESILNERDMGLIEPGKFPEQDRTVMEYEPKTAENLSYRPDENRNFYPGGNDRWHEGGEFEPFPDRPDFPGDEPKRTRPNAPEWDRPEPPSDAAEQAQPPVTNVRTEKQTESVRTVQAVTGVQNGTEQDKQNDATQVYEEIIPVVSTAAAVSQTASGSTVSSKAVTEPTSFKADNIGRPPFDKDFPDPYKGSVKRAYIMVLFSNEKNIDRIIYQYFDDADENEIKTAASSIAESSGDRGKITIGDYRLRYMKKENPKMMGSGFRLLFLDRTLEISTINRLLFIFIIIGSVGIIVIFGISVLLANWMIKPVDMAWKQQKQFVADASHELKTPLTVISSNTDVILSSPDDTVASQAKWINYIKEETKRMTKLVNNMLYIAKYDSNEIKFVAGKFDLSDVMSSICLHYEPIFFENGRTFETEIEEGIFINGDEDKLKQLINILLDNAGKYSAENSEIRAVLMKDPKTGKIAVTVSNKSDYIPSEKLERLFDRFYRLDGSRNRKTGGSGLGLNIARSIAEAHGGRIYAKHESGVTSFIAEI